MRTGACHLLPGSGARLAVTVDALVEDVHFHADVDPLRLGHKCAAVNLSDLAAMGARAVQLLLLVQQPDDDTRWRAAVVAGARRLCRRHGARLDAELEAGAQRRISVQAVGRLHDGVALTRAGARIGDRIAVTGTLGDAGGALALRAAGALRKDRASHRFLRARLECPDPRLAAGAALRGLAAAALDISDGLAGDVQHLLGPLAPGARLQLDALPLSPALTASFGREQAERLAATAGDDYELCIAIAPGALAEAGRRLQALGLPLTVVGEVCTGAGVRWLRHGRPVAVDGGYRHRFDAPA